MKRITPGSADNQKTNRPPYWTLILVAITIFAFAPGCANTSNQAKAVTQDVSANLEPGHGYLLLSVTTNRGIDRLYIEGEVELSLTQADLQKGSNYILKAVPAGSYAIAGIDLSLSRYEFEEADYWQFEVKENTISYVGDLKTEFSGSFYANLNYGITNRSSFALQFLETHFPTLLSSMTAVYAGFGKDKFLQLMTGNKALNTSNTITEGMQK